ncbi:DUF6511 domain-containing protein [Lysobacter sp. Hz 25]|uniref:DUF6511 domain-containing protein n=1 Tax=Lysobacter sp. Hz 25 TaxID=3383698 RepID=UPI0038D43DB3
MTPCWGCGRAARGLGHLDVRRRIGDPRRAPYRWAFCTTTCQDAFHQLYDTRRRSDPAALEDLLPVTHPLSHDVQRACIQAFASVVDGIGYDVPLGHYNQTQATQVIEAITQAYEVSIRSQSNPRSRRTDGFEDEEIPF